MQLKRHFMESLGLPGYPKWKNLHKFIFPTCKRYAINSNNTIIHWNGIEKGYYGLNRTMNWIRLWYNINRLLFLLPIINLIIYATYIVFEYRNLKEILKVFPWKPNFLLVVVCILKKRVVNKEFPMTALYIIHPRKCKLIISSVSNGNCKNRKETR